MMHFTWISLYTVQLFIIPFRKTIFVSLDHTFNIQYLIYNKTLYFYLVNIYHSLLEEVIIKVNRISNYSVNCICTSFLFCKYKRQKKWYIKHVILTESNVKCHQYLVCWYVKQTTSWRIVCKSSTKCVIKNSSKL